MLKLIAKVWLVCCFLVAQPLVFAADRAILYPPAPEGKLHEIPQIFRTPILKKYQVKIFLNLVNIL